MLNRDEVESKVDFSRGLVSDIVIAAVTPTYESRLNQSRCKKGKNETKQRKSLGIFIGEERRAENERVQSGLTEKKKPRLQALKSWMAAALPEPAANR